LTSGAQRLWQTEYDILSYPGVFPHGAVGLFPYSIDDLLDQDLRRRCAGSDPDGLLAL
jgi:hypothetical protein